MFRSVNLNRMGALHWGKCSARFQALLLSQLIVCFSLLALTPQWALAQGDDYPFANTIPAAPAFSFLGVAPANVARPTTARALTTDLLNAIGPEGDVQQGVAVEFAPWSIIPDLRITLQDYQNRRTHYILANTQVSLGTVRTSGDCAATDVGLGLRMTLFNRGDPMGDRSFIQELDKRRTQWCGDMSTLQPGEAYKYADCLDTLYTNYRTAWLRDNWNASALSLAAATGWSFRDSKTDSSEWMGLEASLTGALRIGGWGQGLLQVGYEHRAAMQPDTTSQDRIDFGVRCLVGAPKFNFYVEYTGSFDAEGSDADAKYLARFSGGVEYRLADGMWLSTGIGRELPSTAAPDRIFTLANIRWEMAKGPRLK